MHTNKFKQWLIFLILLTTISACWMASACKAMPSNKYHRAANKTTSTLLSTDSTPAVNRTLSLLAIAGHKWSDVITDAGREEPTPRHWRREKRRVRRRGDQPLDDGLDSAGQNLEALGDPFLADNLPDIDNEDNDDVPSLLTGEGVEDAPLPSNKRRTRQHQEDETKFSRRKARRKSHRQKSVDSSVNNSSPSQPVRRRQHQQQRQQHQRKEHQPLRKEEEVRHRLSKWGHRHIVPMCGVNFQYELKSSMSGFVVPNDRGHVVADEMTWGARNKSRTMWTGETWTFGPPGINRSITLLRFRQKHNDAFQYLCPFVTKNRKPGQEKYAFKLRPAEHAWDCFFQMCPAGCNQQLIHRQPPTWNGTEAESYEWVKDYRCPESPKLPSSVEPDEGSTIYSPEANEIDVVASGPAVADRTLLRLAFNAQGRPLKLSRNKELSQIATRRLLHGNKNKRRRQRDADGLEEERADRCQTSLHLKYSFEVIPYPQEKTEECYAPDRTFRQTPL